MLNDEKEKLIYETIKYFIIFIDGDKITYRYFFGKDQFSATHFNIWRIDMKLITQNAKVIHNC